MYEKMREIGLKAIDIIEREYKGIPDMSVGERFLCGSHFLSVKIDMFSLYVYKDGSFEVICSLNENEKKKFNKNFIKTKLKGDIKVNSSDEIAQEFFAAIKKTFEEIKQKFECDEENGEKND